jgi:hypothetical protein
VPLLTVLSGTSSPSTKTSMSVTPLSSVAVIEIGSEVR